jgi:hypothetical protein
MTILFKELIIRPALESLGRWSQAYEDLLFMTFLCESEEGRYFKDGREGPGIGAYNILPKMCSSVIGWLNGYHQRGFKEICLSTCFYQIYPSNDALVHNLRWATIIVYIWYLRETDDCLRYPGTSVEEIAFLYKKHYSTSDKSLDDILKLFCSNIGIERWKAP